MSTHLVIRDILNHGGGGLGAEDGEGDAFDYGEGEESFEDVRLELQAVGHNLTSVLMNPRESLLDEMQDEFVADQAQPLDLPYRAPGARGGDSLHAGSERGGLGSSHSQSGGGLGGSAHSNMSSHSTSSSSHNFSLSLHGMSTHGSGSGSMGGGGSSSYLSTLMAFTGLTTSSSSISEAERAHARSIADRLNKVRRSLPPPAKPSSTLHLPSIYHPSTIHLPPYTSYSISSLRVPTHSPPGVQGVRTRAPPLGRAVVAQPRPRAGSQVSPPPLLFYLSSILSNFTFDLPSDLTLPPPHPHPPQRAALPRGLGSLLPLRARRLLPRRLPPHRPGHLRRHHQPAVPARDHAGGRTQPFQHL